MTNRRTFIRDCSAFAVSVAVAAQAVPLPAAAIELGTFARLMNSRFLLRTGGNSQPLDLIEAKGNCRSFSLLFRGTASRPLEQDTYSFEHARLGEFQMFIVPVGRPDGSCCYYEAVFNRATREELYG